MTSRSSDAEPSVEPGSRPLRILFILADPRYIRLFEPALDLLAEQGHHLHLAFAGWDEANEAPSAIVPRLMAKHPTIMRSSFSLQDDDVEPWVIASMLVRSGLDYLRYLDPRFDYMDVRKQKYRAHCPLLIRIAGESRLGRTRFGNALLTRTLGRFEAMTKPGSMAARLLDEHRPDLLLVTPVVGFQRHADFLVAARDRGIRNGVCVASWDNLSAKTRMHGAPDFVTVWNEIQHREATDMHGIAGDVIVTGAQPFDHWFEWKPSRSRADFYSEVGLEEEKPYVLYTGSGALGFDEPTVVNEWVRELRSSNVELLSGVNILVRPHPAYAAQWTDDAVREAGQGVRIWPRAPELLDGVDARNDFYDSIYHSAAVVGINSSSMIEAAIIGRPVLSLMLPHFEHVQMRLLHFRYLTDVGEGMMKVSRSYEEHLDQLATILASPELQAYRPEGFLRDFLRPHGLDQPAAPLLAAAIERQGRTPARRTSPQVRLARVGLSPLVKAAAALCLPAYELRYASKATRRAAKQRAKLGAQPESRGRRLLKRVWGGAR